MSAPPSAGHTVCRLETSDTFLLSDADVSVATDDGQERVTTTRLKRRFSGSLDLIGNRPVNEVSRAIDEVIQHLSSLQGAKVKLSLEIEVTVPNGIPDSVVRTVTENARALKFTSALVDEE